MHAREIIRAMQLSPATVDTLRAFELLIESRYGVQRCGKSLAAFDLEALAAADGFSGAEIEQAVVSTLYTALSEKQDITTQHILAELRAIMAG